MTELLVGLAAAGVILIALSSLIITSMHQTSRVSARVEATQRARVTLAHIMQQLHSACVAPQIAPVYPKSTGTELEFIHKAGSAAIPVPDKTKIIYSAGTLTELDYRSTGGSAPVWTFAATPYSERTLITGISPPPGGQIFSYYRYFEGRLSTTPLVTPLNELSSQAVEVKVSFVAAPERTPVPDPSAAAGVSDTALFRLTTPSYSQEVFSPPCQ